MTTMLRRREDGWLLFYQGVVSVALAGVFFGFIHASLRGRKVVFLLSAMLCLTTEALLLWFPLRPVLRFRRLFLLHRLTFAIIPPPSLYYRLELFNPPRHDNKKSDGSPTLDPTGGAHV